MNKMISPSVMCADPFLLRATLDTFETEKIEYLHMDVMDGSFVPNFTLGTDYCRFIRKHTTIPLDYHFMVNSPERLLDWFPITQNDLVSVHAESTSHLQKVLASIKSKGARAFVALNPATPLCFLEEVTEDIDGVLIMTVNPGFAGQKLIPSTLDKIKRTRAFLNAHGLSKALIEVDGNVSFENAVKMRNAGADIFVAGTSSVFNKDLTLIQGIRKMREILEG